MKIYLAADHRGFELKEQIKKYLNHEKYEIVDVSNNSKEQTDDYPDFVHKLYCKMKNEPESRGIVLCGSGIGVTISANRFSLIRCGLCFNKDQTKMARAHDNINVLALAADYIKPEAAYEIIDIFLNTQVDSNPKYAKRLTKINNYAKNTDCTNSFS
jgi:ribose 5-phosphate isomerase B